jgi:anthranilate/para-aminobenzoate synthase component II
MGLRHRSWPVRRAVSPESILTGEGHRLLRNFLEGRLIEYVPALIEKPTRR